LENASQTGLIAAIKNMPGDYRDLVDLNLPKFLLGNDLGVHLLLRLGL
jgi:hypothetical protein